MSTPLKQALVEAAWLLQAVVAGVVALSGQNVWHGYRPDILQILSYTIASVLAMVVLFLVFVQLRLPSPSKALMLQIEVAKSGIVTALLVWHIIERSISYQYFIAVLGFVLPCLIFYPTLFVAYKHWKARAISL